MEYSFVNNRLPGADLKDATAKAAIVWDAVDTPERRAKYYRLEDMKKEAAKAV